jgi:ubiquinone/menaquinone biosynthesis C-methylase UbiE
VKDIVANRRRVSLHNKWKTAALALRENGLSWCGYLFAYYISSRLAERAHSQMHRLRRERGLPGLNSAALNQHIWNSWDWSAQGEEWSSSEEWKQSVIRGVLDPNIPAGGSILEIGPGAGRWTVPLLARARDYTGVDISSTCIEHCRKRFANEPRAQFVVGSGRDLRDVATESIDAIWSFDVFVHINAAEIAGYLDDFVRVLRPGGIAVIHHGAAGGTGGGWRSDLTAAAFAQMLAQRHLKIQQVMDQWADGAEMRKLTFGDQISVISRPR